MAFLFKSKKSPAELVKMTITNIQGMLEEPDEKNVKKSSEKVSANLSEMKFMLYGDSENDPKKENIDKLMEGLFQSPLLLFIQHIKKLEFEARKDVAQIYNYILRQKKQQAIEYVQAHPEILQILVKGYEDAEIALNCGSILRECIRHQQLCEMVLRSPELFNAFFDYVQLSTFDVASDAFATFKLILTKHKVICAKFLESNFDDVFRRYNALLESKNYVTKRQSLKLLGEILLDRSNFKVMMKYINDPENLKIMMNLLRGTTKAIQFEAFHVFKIFVANPQKAKPIVEILSRNRDKLIEFLKKFQTDKEDEQFNEEKKILLGALAKLEAPKEDESKAQPLSPTQAAQSSASASSAPVSSPRSSGTNPNATPQPAPQPPQPAQ